MRIITRSSLVLAVAAWLAATPVARGGAQTEDAAKVTTIAYEASASGTGITLKLAPGGTAVVDTGGGFSSAEVGEGPSAAGSAEAIKGRADTKVESQAPPDKKAEHKEARGFQDQGVANVLTATAGAGVADSSSEADDGTPSTENESSFGASTVVAGSASVLAATVEVGAASTSSVARASGTDVSADATSDGVVVRVVVQASALQALQQQTQQLQTQLCGGLGGLPTVGPTLGPACNNLFQTATGPVEFATITVGDAQCSCSWDGDKPGVSGNGAPVTVAILGQQVQQLPSGGAPQTHAGGTPLELTVAPGSFQPDTKNASPGEEDTSKATASGATLDLLAKQVQLRFSTSSCALSGKVTTETEDEVLDEVLARTGGAVLPYLLGGAGLVAGALRLRRFLRRR